MAKFCTNCGKELDDNAALCLNCGTLVETPKKQQEKKKKKGLPAWTIVLIVLGCMLIILPIVCAIVLFTGFSAYKDKIGNSIENEINNKGETIYGTIGDTLRSDDLKITLNGAYMYSSIGEGDHADVPASGKEYLVFFFNVENTDSENEYISYHDFDGYVDGYTVSRAHLFNDIDGTPELSTVLAPGTKTVGYIAYEIDTSWEGFELHYSDDDYLDSKTLVFKVINEESDATTAGA